MAVATLIVGNDGTNILQGTSGRDLIYGFDPDGPQSNVSSITASRVASGLTLPVFAGAPTGEQDRLFVVELTGAIRVLDLNSNLLLATPFLDLSGVIAAGGEEGLLGLAFDPQFNQNGFIYVNFINASHDTESRRYQVSAADANKIDPATATTIIVIDQPDGRSNHKGGWLGFGPDNYLYAALGDGGGGGDPDNLSQNPDSLLGKMLRLDVRSDAFPSDPARNYAIPADNPFLGTAGADEIWALGLRNPWRNGFDRGLGDLYIADVGQNAWEEVDIGAPGANYGWRRYEGPGDFSPTTELSIGVLTHPVYFYDRSVGQSITGGYVYRGSSEGLHGQYFFADFSQGQLFTLQFYGSAWVATERTSQIVPDAGRINNLSSFGEDGLGNLYAVDIDGDIFRLMPSVVSADQTDILDGQGGDDILIGGSGHDYQTGGAGADTLDGGPGYDYARYNTALSGVLADLANAASNSGDAAGDVFISIAGLHGSAFNDILFGDEGANDIHGFGGADTVDGRNGDDVLDGGPGADALTGGPGKDMFVLRRGESQGDSVTDFSGNGTPAEDQLLFQGYGTVAEGASFLQLDPIHWVINSADGMVQETIGLTNGATVHPSDYIFA